MLFSDAPRRLPSCQAITVKHMTAYERFSALVVCGPHGSPTTLADDRHGHHSAKRRNGRGETAVLGAGEGETGTDSPLLT